MPYVTVLTDMADLPPHFWIEPGQDQTTYEPTFLPVSVGGYFWLIVGTERRLLTRTSSCVRRRIVLKRCAPMMLTIFAELETRLLQPWASRICGRVGSAR